MGEESNIPNKPAVSKDLKTEDTPMETETETKTEGSTPEVPSTGGEPTETTTPTESPLKVNEEDEEGDDEDEPFEDDTEMDIPTRFTRSGRRRATPFPVKLMKVLSMKEFRHIIAWTPSGKSFSIIKPKLFTAEILPTYFKSAKFSSFTRKLHRWGYMRHYRGPEAGSFFHKDFQRGQLEMAEKMTCYKPETLRRSAKKPKAAKSRKSEQKASEAMAANVNINAQKAAMDTELAIELEVARRLRQRMDAATISQQAQLVAMQQQQKLQALQMPSFATPLGAAAGLMPSMVPSFESQAAMSGFPTLGPSQGLPVGMRGLGGDPLGTSLRGLSAAGFDNMFSKPSYGDPTASLGFQYGGSSTHTMHGAKMA